MKPTAQFIAIILIGLGLLAAILIPSVTRCGIAYVKVHTLERGTLIGTTGLETGDWLGREVYEAELVHIVNKHINKNQRSKFFHPFAPSSYRVSCVVEMLIQIRNSEIKELCIQLLNDPELGDRAPEFLAEIGDPSVSPHLIRAMEKAEGRDFPYLAALHTLKDKRAIPFFIEKFDTPYLQKYSAQPWLKSIVEISGEELPVKFPSKWNSRSSQLQLHAELIEWWEEYSNKHDIGPL